MLKYFMDHLHVTVTRKGERIIDTGSAYLREEPGIYPFNSVVLSNSSIEKFIVTFDLK